MGCPASTVTLTSICITPRATNKSLLAFCQKLGEYEYDDETFRFSVPITYEQLGVFIDPSATIASALFFPVSNAERSTSAVDFEVEGRIFVKFAISR